MFILIASTDRCCVLTYHDDIGRFFVHAMVQVKQDIFISASIDCTALQWHLSWSADGRVTSMKPGKRLEPRGSLLGLHGIRGIQMSSDRRTALLRYRHGAAVWHLDEDDACWSWEVGLHVSICALLV